MTNLARTGVADDVAIGTTIFKAWLSYLLDHRARLPEGFMYGLDVRLSRELVEEKWLERYSALAVYELARIGWHYRWAERQKEPDSVSDWEAGKGHAGIAGVYLYDSLLALVLPRIAPKLSLTWTGDVFIEPPVVGWREILNNCHDFISKPIRWSRFASFTGRIADYLHHSWSGNSYFNSKYADLLSGFSEDDLSLASRMFEKLLDDRYFFKRPTGLDSIRLALLKRFIDIVGDLEISNVRGNARIDTFATGLDRVRHDT